MQYKGFGSAHLDHVGSDEADAASPALRRVVEHVVNAEARILAGKLVQILSQENVVLVHVGEDQVNLSLVAGRSASENSLCNLQHGSDSSATSNHTKVPDHVGGVNHGALGALDLHLVADVEGCEVTADVAGGVALDEQVEVAGVDIGGDGSVGADDLLVGDNLGLGVLDIKVGGEGNVLANGQAEDAVGRGQGEAVDGGVVGEDGLFGKREFLEDSRVKDLLLFCGIVVSVRCVGRRKGRRDLTVVEDLVATQSSGDCKGERQPLQLEGSGANNQNGRGNVHAGDVLRCQWARGLCGVLGGHGGRVVCSSWAE